MPRIFSRFNEFPSGRDFALLLCLIASACTSQRGLYAQGNGDGATAEEAFSRDICASLAKRLSANEANDASNVTISPAGLFQTLAMLSIATEGDVRTELQRAIHLPEVENFDWEALHARAIPAEYLFDVELANNAGYGVKVVAAPRPDTNSAQAGLLLGDLIFTVNDQPIRRVKDLIDECNASGGQLELTGYAAQTGRIFQNVRLRLQPIRLPSKPGSDSALRNLNVFLYNRHVNPQSAFLQTLTSKFSAVVHQFSDFSEQEIQSPQSRAWMQQYLGNANRLLSEVLAQEADSDFLFANISIAQSNWQRPFTKLDELESFETPTATVAARFMRRKGNFLISQTSSDRLIEIDVDQPELAVRLWQSTDEVGCSEVLRKMATEAFRRDMVSGLKREAIDLWMPMFSIATSFDRAAVSELLDLQKTLSPRTRFPAISNDARINDIRQTTVIDVDDMGIRASSVTVIPGTVRGGMPDYLEVRVDQPFVIELSLRSGGFLFLGVVNDPTADVHSN
jgi:serine protease inhibitor